MLVNSATPTTTQTSTTVTTPTRPGRLRGLSYLRSLSSRSDAPPLVRSTSSPNTTTLASPQLPEIPAVPPIDQLPAPSTPTMSRNRAATTSGPTPTASEGEGAAASTTTEQTIRFIPHIETRASRPSLHFAAISKTLRSSTGKIRVGRYTEREPTAPSDEILPVGFKSKVVSRRHCEFWCSNGQWFVKDVKSSSGTFLNHVRLSSPGVESRPFPVNDGDVVQLGIDFKGGEEVIFRCVKIRVECNRGWQKTPNTFNTATHKKLLRTVAGKNKRDSDAASVNNHECSICLNPITPCQSLFVAPCSHVWHYKCVRGLINGPHYPNFLCPNCRLVADLEADVEPPEEEFVEDDEESEHEEGVAGSAGSSDEAAVAAGATTDTSPESTGDEAPEASSALGSGMTTPTRARPIPLPSIKHQGSPEPGFTTPGSNAPFAAIADGLLTPRNDAGPFVFNGSAGIERALNEEERDAVPRQQEQQ